jgi:antitoxin HicB
METKTKRKPLEYYLSLKYPVTLYPAEEGGYAVEIEDLPGCISQGDTIEEAERMIEEAKQLWLESVYEDGLDIPLPRNEEEYSGKFNIRLPKSLHRKLDKLAHRDGVSLNQYLVSTLSHATGMDEGRVSERQRPRYNAKK